MSSNNDDDDGYDDFVQLNTLIDNYIDKYGKWWLSSDPEKYLISFENGHIEVKKRPKYKGIVKKLYISKDPVKIDRKDCSHCEDGCIFYRKRGSDEGSWMDCPYCEVKSK